MSKNHVVRAPEGFNIRPKMRTMCGRVMWTTDKPFDLENLNPETTCVRCIRVLGHQARAEHQRKA